MVRHWVIRSKLVESGDHFSTTFGTTAASLDTFPHVAKPLTVARTLVTNLCAFRTEMLMMRRLNEHHVGARSTNFRTSHHKSKMCGFGVLAASFEAMPHRHAKADLIAI